jgi:hypothetical protein
VRLLDCPLSELMAEMMQGVSPLTRSSRARRKTASTVDPEFIVAPLFRGRFGATRLRSRPAMQTLRRVIAESAEAFDPGHRAVDEIGR